MNKDIGKFVYDSMKKEQQKDKNHEKDLTKNNVLVCILQTELAFSLAKFMFML